MLQNLRRPVIACQQDVGKRFVVAQLNVEAWAKLLDQVRFQQQRFGLGRRGNNLHHDRLGNHSLNADRVAGRSRIGGEPLAHALGLADIEHLAGRIQHPVDAGRRRSELHGTRDRRPANRQGPFRQCVGGLFLHVRQARFLVVFDGGSRGVDIVCRKFPRQGLLARSFRIVGVVGHGPQAKCAYAIRPAADSVSISTFLSKTSRRRPPFFALSRGKGEVCCQTLTRVNAGKSLLTMNPRAGDGLSSA